MTIKWITAIAAISIAGVTAASTAKISETIDQMPAALETQFALSAAPPQLRDKATVYLLDPKKGYQLARQGTSGVTCIVERTLWELGDFRNDVYVPLCYDAAGTKTYLKYIMDAAEMRIQGMSAAAVKAQIEKRYRNKTYPVPERVGVSYMVAPLMRAPGPPDLQIHTMSMPHLMFYAPHVTNADLGAVPDLRVHSSLLNPFIDQQGIAEHSYIIQLIGAAEKAKILRNEKVLVDALCAYRDILCLGADQHSR